MEAMKLQDARVIYSWMITGMITALYFVLLN